MGFFSPCFSANHRLSVFNRRWRGMNVCETEILVFLWRALQTLTLCTELWTWLWATLIFKHQTPHHIMAIRGLKNFLKVTFLENVKTHSILSCSCTISCFSSICLFYLFSLHGNYVLSFWEGSLVCYALNGKRYASDLVDIHMKSVEECLH